MVFVSKEAEKSFRMMKTVKKWETKWSVLSCGTFGLIVRLVDESSTTFSGVDIGEGLDDLLTKTTRLVCLVADGGTHVMFFFMQYVHGEPPSHWIG